MESCCRTSLGISHGFSLPFPLFSLAHIIFLCLLFINWCAKEREKRKLSENPSTVLKKRSSRHMFLSFCPLFIGRELILQKQWEIGPGLSFYLFHLSKSGPIYNYNFIFLSDFFSNFCYLFLILFLAKC